MFPYPVSARGIVVFGDERKYEESLFLDEYQGPKGSFHFIHATDFQL